MHRVWIPRPRTEAEQRRHQGGNGIQRTIKRERRLREYLRGEWKPAWLRQYITDKTTRMSTSSAGRLPTTQPEQDVQPAAPDTGSQDDVRSTAADDQPDWWWANSGWREWHQYDPASSWTAWNDWSEWTPETSTTTMSFSSSSSSSTSTSMSPSSSSSSSSTTAAALSPALVSLTMFSFSTIGSTSSPWTSTTTSTSLLDDVGATAGFFPEVSTATLRAVVVSNDPYVVHFVDESDGVNFMQLRNSERATLQEAGVSPASIDRVENLMNQLQEHQVQGQGPEARWALSCLVDRAAEGEDAVSRLIDMMARRLQPQGYFPVRRVPRTQHEQNSMFDWARQYSGLLREAFEDHLRVPLLHSDTNPSPDLVSPSPRRDEGDLKVVTRQVVFDDDNEQEETAASSATSTTTSSTFTSSTTTSFTSCTTTSSTALLVAVSGDVFEEVDGIAGVIFVQGLVELTDDEEDRLVSSSGTNSWLCPLLLSSTSTTTSSSGLGLTWPSDIVRDTVNNQLIFGGQADVQELLFRLVARQRHLTHMQRLLMAAMEEALPWLHRSLSAEAFNAANTDEAVWNSVVAESVHGSGPSSSTPNHVVQAPMLLLGPGLPDSMEGVLSTLPDVPPMVIPFLRRRAWQQHVRALQGTGGIRGPTDRDQNNNDNNDRLMYHVRPTLFEIVDDMFVVVGGTINDVHLLVIVVKGLNLQRGLVMIT
eukprot:s8068_g2.t1